MGLDETAIANGSGHGATASSPPASRRFVSAEVRARLEDGRAVVGVGDRHRVRQRLQERLGSQRQVAVVEEPSDYRQLLSRIEASELSRAATLPAKLLQKLSTQQKSPGLRRGFQVLRVQGGDQYLATTGPVQLKR